MGWPFRKKKEFEKEPGTARIKVSPDVAKTLTYPPSVGLDVGSNSPNPAETITSVTTQTPPAEQPRRGPGAELKTGLETEPGKEAKQMAEDEGKESPEVCEDCEQPLDKSGYCPACDYCSKCKSLLDDDGNCNKCNPPEDEPEPNIYTKEQLKDEVYSRFDEGLSAVEVRKRLAPENIVDEKGDPYHNSTYGGMYRAWKAEQAKAGAPLPPAAQAPSTPPAPAALPDPELNALVKEINKPKYAKVLVEYRDARKMWATATPDERAILKEEIAIHLTALKSALDSEFGSEQGTGAKGAKDKLGEKYDKFMDTMMEKAMNPPDPLKNLAAQAENLDKIRGTGGISPEQISLEMAKIVAGEVRGTRQDITEALGSGGRFKGFSQKGKEQGKPQPEPFYCSLCKRPVLPTAHNCPHCGAVFTGRMSHQPGQIPPVRPPATSPPLRAPPPDYDVPPEPEPAPAEEEYETQEPQPPAPAAPERDIPALTPYAKSVLSQVRRLANFIVTNIECIEKKEQERHDPVKKAGVAWEGCEDGDRKALLFAAQLGYDRIMTYCDPLRYHPELEQSEMDDILAALNTDVGREFITAMLTEIEDLAEQAGVALTEADEQSYLEQTRDMIDIGNKLRAKYGHKELPAGQPAAEPPEAPSTPPPGDTAGDGTED